MQRIELGISEKIKHQCPNLELGVWQARVEYRQHDAKLWSRLKQEAKPYENLDLRHVLALDGIYATRAAYKAMGKDPSRYRPSNEALTRRLAKGNGLFQVNNLVDIGNLLSLRYRNSVGVLDLDAIQGQVTFTIGGEGESYPGIGRGEINLANLPVLKDKIGPFGSTTGDSARTMIKEETSLVLMVMFSFDGRTDMLSALALGEELLKTHAAAGQVFSWRVKA